MSAFTKCFRPVSKYPSDFPHLVAWLKADSGVTFDIASKKASAWTDQSGNGNNVANATSAKQPLRYGYDGANDKTYLSFDGTNDGFASSANCPITSTSYTIFTVAKQNNTEAGRVPIFDYTRTASSIRIMIGYKDNKFYSFVKNNLIEIEHESAANTNSYGLIATSLDGSGGRLTTIFNNESAQISTAVGYAAASFDDSFFGIASSSVSGFANTDIAEIIVYNGELTDKQKNDVRDYLNNKYKIY